MATYLQNDLTAPQNTTPGDAPYDTTDWRERASSATPDKAAAAEAGHLSVNAVVKTGEVAETSTPPGGGGGRTQTYTAYEEDGVTPVTVTFNLDTGVSTATGQPAPSEPIPVEPAPEPAPSEPAA